MIARKHKIDTKLLRTHRRSATSYTDVMTEIGQWPADILSITRGANASGTARNWISPDQSADFSPRLSAACWMRWMSRTRNSAPKPPALLAAAQDAGLKTSVDVVSEDSDRFAKIVAPALKHVDYCILNEIEAGKTTGFKIRASGRQARHRGLAPRRRRAVAKGRARTGGDSFSRRRLRPHPQRRRCLAIVAESSRQIHRRHGRRGGCVLRRRPARAARRLGSATLPANGRLRRAARSRIRPAPAGSKSLERLPRAGEKIRLPRARLEPKRLSSTRSMTTKKPASWRSLVFDHSNLFRRVPCICRCGYRP